MKKTFNQLNEKMDNNHIHVKFGFSTSKQKIIIINYLMAMAFDDDDIVMVESNIFFFVENHDVQV